MARAKGAPAAAEIVTVIAGVADAAAQVEAQAAVREVTVVATPAAVADAVDGRISSQYPVRQKGRSDAVLFILELRNSIDAKRDS
jgi:hypothetical protein